MRILVAEDEEAVRSTYFEILTKYFDYYKKRLDESSGLYNVEIKCETVENGKQALERIEKGGIDLLITDYLMPQMNGYELAKNIREMNNTMPIILSTGFYEDLGYEKSEFSIKNDFFQSICMKPLTPSELIKAVDFALQVSKKKY